jgi:DUF917 family protein
MREFTVDEIEPLAIGAWILGTGGGGSPYHGFLNLRKLYAKGHQVGLIDADELNDDDMVAVVSNMGAPLVGQERLNDPQTVVSSVRLLEDYFGRKFDAVMSVEIGGSNAFQPFLAAALMGIPVVDADAMGRAFPEAQMTSFAIADLKPYPLALADIRDNSVLVTRAASWKWMERISRKACVEVGSVASTCKGPRTGREVKDHAILRTVSKAVRIGDAVLAARRQHTDPVEAVLDLESGKQVFRGKISDVERRTTAGFLRGSATVEGLEEYRGTAMVLKFQNEFAIATIEDEPCVTTPDLICVLDTVSGEAIGTETLRYGQRVTVIALPAPSILLTPKGLEHVGPRAFGYDVAFKSVFDA